MGVVIRDIAGRFTRDNKSRLGVEVSKATREKMRQARLGKTPWNKKENPSYGAIHDWINYHLGQPKNCENCFDKVKSHYEWANLSGNYLRDLADWARLCVSCHRWIDDTGRKVWVTRRKRQKCV